MVFGSVVAGFLLIPNLGSQHSLALLACGNAAIGLALLWAARGLAPRPRLALTVAPLALMLFFVGLAPDMYTNIFRGREEFRKLYTTMEGQP